VLAAVVLTYFVVSAAAANAASFTITKKLDPPGTVSTPFTFHVDFKPFFKDPTLPAGYEPPGDFQLSGGQSKTFDVHRGFYTVTELSLTGWKVLNIECIATVLPGNQGGLRPDPAPEDAFVIDVPNRSARIELSVHENKGCDFTNQQIPTYSIAPPVVAPKPVVAPPPAPPRQGVLGEQARPAAAQLIGPRLCVSRRYTVTVRGGPVATVVFFVNGRKVRSLKARRNQTRFSARMPAPAARRQRVSARVVFAGSASPRAKTLRATVNRCAEAAVAPKFTG
jgi:hypothetical protein